MRARGARASAESGNPRLLQLVPGSELRAEPGVHAGIGFDFLRIRRRVGVAEQPAEGIDLLVQHARKVQIRF